MKRVTLNTFRRMTAAEEHMMRAVMPKTSAADAEPLVPHMGRPAVQVVARTQSGARLVKAAQPLTFTLSYPAADGGQLLDVTTDVPESVIMREVVVPAGQTSVTVNVQGGRPGSGNLYLKGFGDGTIKIPVTVQ